jgi:hypothetical protein
MTTTGFAAIGSVDLRRASAGRCRPAGWLLLAVAALFVVVPAAAARTDDDDDKNEVKAPARVQPGVREAEFESRVFQNYNHGLPSGRKRLEIALAICIDDINRTCKLSETQKKKIELAGRGDINQFYVLYDKVRSKYLEARDDNQKMNALWNEISPLQLMVQRGIFDEDSLLFRSLHSALTHEQWADFDAVARERRSFRHRTQIEQVVAALELNAPLGNAQRREVIAALQKLIRPPRKSAYAVVMYQISRLPDDKLKPLFDDVQWKAVRGQLNQYVRLKDWLKQSGQLSEEDDDDETNNSKPAAGKDAKPAAGKG